MNHKSMRFLSALFVLILIITALTTGLVFADQRNLIDDPATIYHTTATYSVEKYSVPSSNLKVEEYGVSSSYPAIDTTAVLQKKNVDGTWSNASNTYSFPGAIPNNFASRYGFTYYTTTSGTYRIKLAQPDSNNVVVISHLLLREDY